MNVAGLVARLHATFEDPPRGAISDVIALISASVREQTQEQGHSPEFTSFLVELERELVHIYENSVNHKSVTHLEAFLAVLFSLRPVLPASSIITWFDHLRPALRAPLLSLETKKSLQSLIASVLDESKHPAESRSREFRRRLLELYIFDISEFKTAEESIEELNQNASEVDSRQTWKENIESILEIDLLTSPDHSFALLNVLFAEAASRYAILALVLRVFSTRPKLPPIVALARSNFFDTFLTSTLVDKSTILFEREIVLLLISLPYLAVYSSARLMEILPTLLAVLGRALSWNAEPTTKPKGDESDDDGRGDDIRRSLNSPPVVHKAIFHDQRVDDTLPSPQASSSDASPLEWSIVGSRPSDSDIIFEPQLYFTFIYGIFPCNVVAFLRRPIIHLTDLNFTLPLDGRISWNGLFNLKDIHLRSLTLFRAHSLHPDLLIRDAKSEISDPRPWALSRGGNLIDDVARLVAECTRLDHSDESSSRRSRELNRTDFTLDELLKGSMTVRRKAPMPLADDLDDAPNGNTDRNGSDPHVPNSSLPRRSKTGNYQNNSPYHQRMVDHIRSNSETGSFGSTPKARGRDKLQNISPPFSGPSEAGTPASAPAPGLGIDIHGIHSPGAELEQYGDDDELQVLSSSQGTYKARTAVYYLESPVEGFHGVSQSLPAREIEPHPFHHPLLFVPPSSGSHHVSPALRAVGSAPVSTTTTTGTDPTTPFTMHSRRSSSERVVQASRSELDRPHHRPHHTRSHSNSHSPSPLAHPSPLSLSVTVPLPDDDEEELVEDDQKPESGYAQENENTTAGTPTSATVFSPEETATPLSTSGSQLPSNSLLLGNGTVSGGVSPLDTSNSASTSSSVPMSSSTSTPSLRATPISPFDLYNYAMSSTPTSATLPGTFISSAASSMPPSRSHSITRRMRHGHGQGESGHGAINIDHTLSRPRSLSPIDPSPPNVASPAIPSLSSHTSTVHIPANTTFSDLTPGPVVTDERQLRAFDVIQHENARLRDLSQLTIWMKDEMRHHVERLHQERMVISGEEMERQSLHNRLRDLRMRIATIQRENERLQAQAELTKKNSKQWTDELQAKLRDFRKEKKSWVEEAVALRGVVHDAEARMTARTELMDATEKKYSELQIKWSYWEPKVHKLEETEGHLERLRKQVTIDESEEVKALRADSKALRTTQEIVEKQLMIIASLEHANDELKRLYNERGTEIARLEGRIAAINAKGARSKSPQARFRPLSQSFTAAFRPASMNLGTSTPPPDEAVKKLQAENEDLKEQIEELQVMVEQLRNDAERAAKFRQQSFADSRRKSVSFLHSPLAQTKSSPSPAVLSHMQDSSGDTMSASSAFLPSPPA